MSDTIIPTERITPAERTMRTITLTDRRPVRIVEDDWPIIAEATGGFGCSESVRQHEDGRTIVYGVLTGASCALAGHRYQDWRGGELLAAGADVAAVIRRVGQSGEIPDQTIRECIADLPAEEI